MTRHDHRIPTTHVGSLPRPPDMLETLTAEGGTRSAAGDERWRARVRHAVLETVRQQLRAGIDIVGDGEMGKPSYATYVDERLEGFSDLVEMPAPADLAEYPGYAARLMGSEGLRSVHIHACTGPVRYVGEVDLGRELDDLRAALEHVEVEDAFVTAASPGVIALFHPNRTYGTYEEYLHAVAGAMRAEYRAIVDAGFVLQLDCPDLAMGRHIQFPNSDEQVFLKHAAMHVEALNDATAGIPPDRMRMHLCWGNYEGPHHHDVPLRQIVETVLRARPSGISFEAANPRHAHEWRVWSEVKLPDDKVLLPGVIDTTTNFVEHPDLVAERIERVARLVGPERVIASTDCGFATFAAFTPVDPAIVWAKLTSLSEGARRASKHLWRVLSATEE